MLVPLVAFGCLGPQTNYASADGYQRYCIGDQVSMLLPPMWRLDRAPESVPPDVLDDLPEREAARGDAFNRLVAQGRIRLLAAGDLGSSDGPVPAAVLVVASNHPDWASSVDWTLEQFAADASGTGSGDSIRSEIGEAALVGSAEGATVEGQYTDAIFVVRNRNGDVLSIVVSLEGTAPDRDLAVSFGKSLLESMTATCS